jgi:hypothetical protein
MNSKRRLEQLEQQCIDMDVKLYYDDLRSEGGLCRLRRTFYVIINRRSSIETRIRILDDALARIPAAMAQAVVEESAAPQAAAQPAESWIDDEHEVGVPLDVGAAENKS